MPSSLRSIDLQIIDKLFGMESGFVLDFSDRTMAQFFAEEFNIDIDDQRYRNDGASKAKRLRSFLRKENAETVARVLTALWDYREARRALIGNEEHVPNAHAQLLNLLSRIQGAPAKPLAPQGPPPAFDAPQYARLLGELMSLHDLDPQSRGYAFEDFLKRVFCGFGLLPRGGFRVTGEQIDGSFVLAGETYLIEAKWQNARTPAADLYVFQGKLSARMTWARGLFVSYSGFTDEGLTAFGRGGSVVCMDGLDLCDALRCEIPINKVLDEKVRRSVETGEVLARVRDLFTTVK